MAVQSPLLTAAESMTYLRKSRAWLTRHADEVGCVRDGGRLYFRLTNLDAWIRLHEVPPVVKPTPMPAPARSMPLSGIGRINPFTGLPYETYGPPVAAMTADGARAAREPKKKARASL